MITEANFKTVDYRPTKGELAMEAHNQEIIRLAELNRERTIKPRVIQFEKAGSHVRARYQGGKTFVIGEDRKQAEKRLKFLAAEGRA
jgi:hypothetical protein